MSRKKSSGKRTGQNITANVEATKPDTANAVKPGAASNSFISIFKKLNDSGKKVTEHKLIKYSKFLVGMVAFLITAYGLTRAFYHTSVGDKYVESEPDKALIQYNLAIDSSPDGFGADRRYRKRADLYLDMGEYEKAISDYDMVIATQYYNHNDVYQQKAFAKASIGSYREALEDLQVAVELNPDQGYLYYLTAFCHNRLEEYEEALAALQQAEDLDLKMEAVYTEAAKAHAGLGHYEETLEAYGQALAIEPADTEVLVDRGFLYYNHGDYAHAVQDLEEVIKQDPEDKNALRVLTLGYGKLEDYEKSLTYARRYNELFQSAKSWKYLADAYYRMEDTDQAIVNLEKAIQADPENSSYLHMLSTIYRDQGDYDNAYLFLGRVIALSPSDAETYEERGLLSYEFQHYPEAISDFDTAITLNPGSYSAYYNRGTSYLYDRNFERALSDYNNAIRHDPEQDKTWFMRGQTYYFLEDYENAAADLTKYIEARPDSGMAYSFRGKTWYGLGKKAAENADAGSQEPAESPEALYQKAEDDLAKAIELGYPENATCAYLGHVQFARKTYYKAADAYTKELEQKESAVNYFNRGAAYYNGCDYESALADFEKALEMNPQSEDYASVVDKTRDKLAEAEDGNYYYNRARAYFDSGYSKEAGEYYQKAASALAEEIKADNTAGRKSETLWNLYSRLGTSYYRLRQYQKAIEAYDSQLKLKETDAGYYNRGLAYYYSYEYEAALADFEKAVELSDGEEIYASMAEKTREKMKADKEGK